MKAGRVFLTSIIAFALIGPIFSDAQAQREVPKDAAQTVRKSISIIRDFVNESEQSIPFGILENSAGVAIIPDVTRVAFIAGGRHGTGVLLTHDQNQWSLPVFASISGGSVGAQIGISNTDFVFVFRNRQSIDELQRSGRLDFGLDLTVTAGPVSRTTDWSSIDTDVLAYKRTSGAYAGFSFSGGVLTTDPEMTYSYYIEPSARGYYEEGEDEMLVNDLLSLSEEVIVPIVPMDALRLKRAMDRLSR